MSNLAQHSWPVRVIFHVAAQGERETLDRYMQRTFRELRNDVRKGLARIARSLTQRYASLKPQTGRFASPRMCPFCGLITPRTKSSCVECGKSLAPAR